VTSRMNMLVIVLDAMREDSVVPSLEEPGRCFRAATCIASSPWTLPSCTSLLSGVDSTRHRHFWHSDDFSMSGLVRSLPRQYQKVGLVNNRVMKPSSYLNDGFDAWTFFRDHSEPFDRAAPLIRQARARKPLFLLLHSNISHDYYRPEASKYFDEIFPDESGGAYTLDDRVIQWSGTTTDDHNAVVKTYRASAMKAISRTREILDLVRERDDFVTVVVADHGEGLDYGASRVHHGGRLHEDLIRVPLYFDLPSRIQEHDRTDLRAALESRPVAVTDVLPTLFALAREGAVPPVDGRRIDTASDERVIVSEDRRYLYLKDRFRLNSHGLKKNMNEQDRMENDRVLGHLAFPPVVRSYRLKDTKFILTWLQARPEFADPTDARDALLEIGGRLLGAPSLARRGDQLLAFEAYDLKNDPDERENMLVCYDDAKRFLRDEPWVSSVSVPTGDRDDVDLLAMLAGAEGISAA
jgi:arylsulfatase A-like enzyme